MSCSSLGVHQTATSRVALPAFDRKDHGACIAHRLPSIRVVVLEIVCEVAQFVLVQIVDESVGGVRPNVAQPHCVRMDEVGAESVQADGPASRGRFEMVQAIEEIGHLFIIFWFLTGEAEEKIPVSPDAKLLAPLEKLDVLHRARSPCP